MLNYSSNDKFQKASKIQCSSKFFINECLGVMFVNELPFICK